MKTIRKVPGTPPEGPRTIAKVSGEKYFSTKFHYFASKYFSSFRNFASPVLDTVMSPGAHTLQNPLILYKKPNTNTYSQNKFAIPKKSQK